MKDNLDWKDLYTMMDRDNAGRLTAVSGTAAHDYILENGYRSPSRAWPYSHAKPLLTKKFAKWLKLNHKDSAKKYNLI